MSSEPCDTCATIAPLTQEGLSVRTIAERTGIPRATVSYHQTEHLRELETLKARLPDLKRRAAIEKNDERFEALADCMSRIEELEHAEERRQRLEEKLKAALEEERALAAREEKLAAKRAERTAQAESATEIAPKIDSTINALRDLCFRWLGAKGNEAEAQRAILKLGGTVKEGGGDPASIRQHAERDLSVFLYASFNDCGLIKGVPIPSGAGHRPGPFFELAAPKKTNGKAAS